MTPRHVRLLATADRVYVRPKNERGLGAVVLDPDDFEKLKHAEFYLAPSGFIRVRFLGWRRSRNLDEYLTGQTCKHANNDLLDFRRCNLLPG